MMVGARPWGGKKTTTPKLGLTQPPCGLEQVIALSVDLSSLFYKIELIKSSSSLGCYENRVELHIKTT